ncbi:hypothetical protein NIBR502774_14230 (plasmid) [Rhizobium sp. NIBRBAC000502774]|nr:hypothetical protein NIBR502774_14230 [Rhizobium sp. NIBRBAC000502774]
MNQEQEQVMSRSIGGAGYALMVATLVMFALPSVAKDKGQPAVSEADSTALEMAQDACSRQDFSGLFEAMARSDAVVRRHSSSKIALAGPGKVREIERDSYRDFPVAMLDYSWVTPASLAASEKNPNARMQFLSVKMNQSQKNSWGVDYALADEEGGSPVRNGKPSGSLLFEAKGNCWELVSETSN